MEQLESDRLAIYAVWEPILKTDDERASRKATVLFPDERVRNYWVRTRSVGELFQDAIDLEGEPAWDVYLVYEAGSRWTEETPPRPTFFMHQLRGRLPDDRRLDGPRLKSTIADIMNR